MRCAVEKETNSSDIDIISTQDDDISISAVSFPQPNDPSPANVPQNPISAHYNEPPPDISVMEEKLRILRENLGLAKSNPPSSASPQSDLMDVDNTPDVNSPGPIVEPIDVEIEPLQNRPPWIQKLRAKMPKPMPDIGEKSDEESNDNKENLQQRLI